MFESVVKWRVRQEAAAGVLSCVWTVLCVLPCAVGAIAVAPCQATSRCVPVSSIYAIQSGYIGQNRSKQKKAMTSLPIGRPPIDFDGKWLPPDAMKGVLLL